MKKIVMAGALTMLAVQGCFYAAIAMNLAAAPKTAIHARNSGAPVLLIQDVAVDEQVRQLNGRIEEMSFQILQLQEQLRKAQEDNEFRFQELEKGIKKSGALENPVDGQGRTQNQNIAEASGETTPEASTTLDQGDETASTTGGTEPSAGAPAVDLGSIKFDDQGNVIGEATTPAQNGNDAQTSDQAALSTDPADKIIETTPETTAGGSPDALYQAAYEHILAGDYSAAEGQFRNYIDTHPEGTKIADANFWLGESQYSQAKYSEAAKTFLNAYKSYGKSEKAPEMLLKLAMSLAALESKDTACATLREVPKTYPKASRAVISKVASEQKRLAC